MISQEKYRELVYFHQQLDADYLVDVLDISSAEIIEAFPEKFRDYLDNEYNDDEESYVNEEHDETYDPEE